MSKIIALTEAERAVLACFADIMETAEQVTISRSKVALIFDARKIDRFHELLDIAQADGGREPPEDDEPSLAHFGARDWGDDLEYDAAEHTADAGPAFELCQQARKAPGVDPATHAA